MLLYREKEELIKRLEVLHSVSPDPQDVFDTKLNCVSFFHPTVTRPTVKAAERRIQPGPVGEADAVDLPGSGGSAESTQLTRKMAQCILIQILARTTRHVIRVSVFFVIST
jgi:hypothetical protein